MSRILSLVQAADINVPMTALPDVRGQTKGSPTFSRNSANKPPASLRKQKWRIASQRAPIRPARPTTDESACGNARLDLGIDIGGSRPGLPLSPEHRPDGFDHIEFVSDPGSIRQRNMQKILWKFIGNPRHTAKSGFTDRVAISPLNVWQAAENTETVVEFIAHQGRNGQNLCRRAGRAEPDRSRPDIGGPICPKLNSRKEPS